MGKGGPPERIAVGVALADVLVLTDDLNIPLGTVRIRRGGSSGGHKGLDSLIQAFGTPEFPRLRMGIGPQPPAVGARDFVLSEFDPLEWPVAEAMTDAAADAALCWAHEGLEAAMNRFNRSAENETAPEG